MQNLYNDKIGGERHLGFSIIEIRLWRGPCRRGVESFSMKIENDCRPITIIP